MAFTSASIRAQAVDATLRFVTSVPQMGPVGYRDPLGVISPDGEWLAYTSGEWLRQIHTAGGPVRTLARFERILAIAWHPDGKRIAARVFDSAGVRWMLVDTRTGAARLAWTAPFPKSSAESAVIDPRSFLYVAWSRDGSKLAGVAYSPKGSTLWVGNADGTNGRIIDSPSQLSFPAWTPDGQTVVCLSLAKGRQQISKPCGGEAQPLTSPDAYGPIAFSPDGRTLYFSSPNQRGTLDLYTQPVAGGAPRRLTTFSRDSYAPSVDDKGRVLFGVQDYRTFIAVTSANGGSTRQVTAFQSETPSWSRDDHNIGLTYGSWRRVVDDARYPDIAQDLGLVRADASSPAASPEHVVRASPSEDGWISYTTEIFEGQRRRSCVFIVGVNATTGAVTRPAQRISFTGVVGDIEGAEWLTADSLVLLAREGDRQAIYVTSRDGGSAREVHRFTSEHPYSGLGVSAPGRWAAFVAPAADGYFQIFRVPLAGGTPTQVTTDPTNKTQPAVSHDGASIAYTVFTYQMHFWLMEPR